MKYGNFEYSRVDSRIRIDKYTSSASSVTIPEKIGGLPVTSIGDRAFNGCRKLTLITIPNSVTSIGYEVFRNCSNLISITIPNSVTSIGEGAFFHCSNLRSIDIPNGVTFIGAGAFKDCFSLTSINIPDSVTSIVHRAFFHCSGLTSINIPDGVTSIDKTAFYGCKRLTSVNIPNGVTSIGKSAFRNCSGLTSITIPDSVTSIGDGAFADCISLTSITIPEIWTEEDLVRIFGGKPTCKILRTSCQRVTENSQEQSTVKQAQIKQSSQKQSAVKQTQPKQSLRLQEKLAGLKNKSVYAGEISILEEVLRSKEIADDMIAGVVAPAVDDLENLFLSQSQAHRCRGLISLVDAVSSEKLTNAPKYFRELDKKETSNKSELRTHVVALLLLTNKFFTKKFLPQAPDLNVVKDAAQILAKLKTTF